MIHSNSAGRRFRNAIDSEKPLQIVGTINAYCALQAEQAGYKAIYLSGGGVANTSFGLPDLGVTTMNDVVTDASRITAATDTPLLVDIDTGWGSAFSIARTIKEMERAGVAAVHMEDQVAAKRCGHRPNKALVSIAEMVDRVKAAVDAKSNDDFVLMARTDAYNSEGQQAAIDRACCYVEAGADMIFAEAVYTLDDYRAFTEAVGVPVLANITEFGQTPYFTTSELAEAGASMALYPLSAFRAMSKAAQNVYESVRKDGTQSQVIDSMQTRTALYDVLGYHEYEQKLDKLFSKEQS